MRFKILKIAKSVDNVLNVTFYSYFLFLPSHFDDARNHFHDEKLIKASARKTAENSTCIRMKLTTSLFFLYCSILHAV